MKGGLLAFLLGFTFVTPAFAQGSKSFEYDFGKALQTAPAVDLDGTIYIGGKGSIAAIAPSGTEMWKTNVFSGSASDFGAISIDTDRIYATTSEGVFAFGKNGSRLWTNNIRSVASAVAISSDGTLFVGGSDGTVYGLNRNGSLLWTNRLDDPSTLAMPAGLLAVGEDGKVYVARGILYALDPNDGHILWAGTEQAGKSSPLIGAGGNIYYAGLPELASFKSVSATGTNLWLMPMIGVPEGAVFNENSGRIYVAASGSLYTAQTEGIKSLTLNGSSNWVFNVGNPQGTDVLPVTLKNDDVVVSIGAKVYALSEQGTLKWDYDLTDKAVKGLAVGPNHDIYAAQANGKLTAITGSSPLASNGWPVYGGNARHTGQRTTSVGVVMIAPDLVTTNSAHLTVQVDPAFANGTVYFQYSNGTATNSVAVEVASTNTEPNISTSLSNLLEGTIYGVHAILSNSVQIVTSENVYFRTLGASGGIAPTLTALQGAAALGESVTFSEDGVITVPSPILFSKTNTIDANGHAVVLSGAGMNPILKLTSTAQLTLAGITFANGKAQGEYTDDGTHLANGGAIINDGGELTMTGCVVTNNIALGARVPSSPNPVPPMVSNGLFSSTNMALYEPSNARGGAIWQKGGKLTILNSRFENNQAKGGADAASSGTCEAFGGAIYMTGGSTVVSNSFFLKNQAIGGNGLAVYQNGQPQGGAIYLSQVSATFEDVSVSENVVTGSGLGFPKGGAIATDGGFLLITNVTLSANQVKGTDYLDRHYGSTSDSSYGGALYNGGTVHVWNSSVLDNLASSGLGDPNNPEFGPPGGHSKGGGIYNEGVIAIYNSTLSGNISQDPSLNFFGYPITNGGLGTAVFSSGFVGVTNSTIAYNLIGTEALSSTNTRPFVLKNTILQSNSGKNSGPDIIDAGNNLSSDATPAFITSTSLNNTDSNLGPLEFYGGATKCYALMAGSPAINGADDATAPATDQRGRTRPFGAHADIGSFESSTPFFVWGQIKGYHDPATKLIVGTNQYEVSAEGYFNIGPFSGGELPLALQGGDALFRPNNWNYNLSVDGPITGIASYEIGSFVPDPVAEGTVFTLAGVPNETWRIEESQDLKSWNTNAVYTLDSTGLLSIEITNYTKAAFFISVKQ